MAIPIRPLNTVHQIMTEIGFEPGYAYDDLVFANDAVFIVQFDSESESKMKLFINEDCEEKVFKQIEKGYTFFAKEKGIDVSFNGTFSLHANEKTEEIDIVFNI